jgi:predicted nucleotidyltransferase
MIGAEIAGRLRDWIERERPLLVILFGSALDGPAGPEPDLDLAVLFGRPADPLQAIGDLSAALGRGDVDLMILDHADPIARLAASRGAPVYEAEPGRRVGSRASPRWRRASSWTRASCSGRAPS